MSLQGKNKLVLVHNKVTKKVSRVVGDSMAQRDRCLIRDIADGAGRRAAQEFVKKETARINCRANH
jgi:hypothetical protein